MVHILYITVKNQVLSNSPKCVNHVCVRAGGCHTDPLSVLASTLHGALL